MFFVSSKKLFSFSRYVTVCFDFLVMYKKRLDQKGKVNSKMYDYTNQLTKNSNTHIAQYLTKERQQDHEIWSGNRIQKEKYFTSNIMSKMRQGDQFQISFCFFVFEKSFK